MNLDGPGLSLLYLSNSQDSLTSFNLPEIGLPVRQYAESSTIYSRTSYSRSPTGHANSSKWRGLSNRVSGQVTVKTKGNQNDFEIAGMSN